jgi:hypothetical protein
MARSKEMAPAAQRIVITHEEGNFRYSKNIFWLVQLGLLLSTSAILHLVPFALSVFTRRLSHEIEMGCWCYGWIEQLSGDDLLRMCQRLYHFQLSSILQNNPLHICNFYLFFTCSPPVLFSPSYPLFTFLLHSHFPLICT